MQYELWITINDEKWWHYCTFKPKKKKLPSRTILEIYSYSLDHLLFIKLHYEHYPTINSSTIIHS